jgi:hypothetical protein
MELEFSSPTSREQFIAGLLLFPHDFGQDVHDLGIHLHPDGVVMRTGGRGIHADQLQVRF